MSEPPFDGRPTVTVAIATRQRPAGLERLLHGLGECSSPTAMRWTSTIVVDNDEGGSARAVVDSWRPRSESALVYVPETTPGVSHARNAAVAACETEFLAFIDDDMTPSVQWLDALCSGVLDRNAVAAIGPVPILFESPPPAGLEASGALDFPVWDDGQLIDTIRTGNAIIRTEVLGPAPFEPRLSAIGGEDHLLGRSLHARGLPIVFIEAAVASEWTTAERLEPRALRLRQQRLGVAYTTVELSLETSQVAKASTRLRHTGSAVARIGVGLALSIPGVAARRRWKGHRLLWFGIGQLTAVVGRSFRYY